MKNFELQDKEKFILSPMADAIEDLLEDLQPGGKINDFVDCEKLNVFLDKTITDEAVNLYLRSVIGAVRAANLYLQNEKIMNGVSRDQMLVRVSSEEENAHLNIDEVKSLPSLDRLFLHMDILQAFASVVMRDIEWRYITKIANVPRHYLKECPYDYYPLSSNPETIGFAYARWKIYESISSFGARHTQAEFNSDVYRRMMAEPLHKWTLGKKMPVPKPPADYLRAQMPRSPIMH